MKSIHAISSILAVWGGGSSVWTPAKHALHQARTMRPEDQGTEGLREVANRPNPRQPAPGVPNLLAAALLQGGARTDRRYR